PPEVTPDTKPEIQPEKQPEVPPDTKPEIQPEKQPEVTPDTKPEIQPEKLPEVTPEIKPEIQPEKLPEVTPDTKPEIQPEQPKPVTPSAPGTEASTSGSEGGEDNAPPRRKETDEEKAARRKAALEAREAAKAAAALAKGAEASVPAASAAPAAAAAGAGAAAEGAGEPPAPPKPPSPNQPRLDRAAALLRELVAEDAVEETYINEPNDHLPTLVVKNDRWKECARLFLEHAELGCDYLRNVSGVDYETHMEVVYYPLNMERRETYCIKVRTDREQPSVASVTPLWETANWNEREIFDLLGIDFPGHPDLRRIMMSDDWVGHPLRKDYVPLDPEV
ncbi:MAG: dehydrogenase, partial [Cohnella sp.]|nr:dehydrogenase [Cohnella sp.]